MRLNSTDRSRPWCGALDEKRKNGALVRAASRAGRACAVRLYARTSWCEVRMQPQASLRIACSCVFTEERCFADVDTPVMKNRRTDGRDAACAPRAPAAGTRGSQRW